MSCFKYWQPATENKQAAAHATIRRREVLVIGHLGNVVGVQLLKQPGAFLDVKFRIFGLDADKKTVG
jgi:hypothetical protein